MLTLFLYLEYILKLNASVSLYIYIASSRVTPTISISHVHKPLAKTYNYLCHLFIQLVEDFTSHWQVPLPQLRILQRALCYFAQASTSFPSNCDHVLDTLSSLALWVHNFLIWYSHPVNFIIIKLVKRVLKNLCTNYCLFYHTVNTLLVQHTGY